MTRHIFKYIALFVILLAACACKRESSSLYAPEEIKFDARTASQQTKAATDFPTTSDFGVTSFHTQGTASYQYFDNVQVTYSDSWKTATTLYWPKAAIDDGTLLEFRGYSPYAAEKPWCTFPDNKSIKGSYSFNPKENPDLMYSNPNAMSPATPGTVSLSFCHALGQTTFSFTCERFDDSIEKGTYQGMEIYCKYTEDNPDRPVEDKSFVFLSGNYPSGLSAPDQYTVSEQAFDLKNPIQNIWYVEVTNLRVDNLAWAGEFDMTTDGTLWTKPSNSIWASPSNRQPLMLLESDDPFYFSPNTKGFPMPFGTYVVLPQDLQPVLSAQKPVISIDLIFRLFRGEENASNDSATSGDRRSQIFDYRDIAQYVTEGNEVVDGENHKSGSFVKWHHVNAHRDFPDGTSLNFGTAVLRKDAKPLLEVTRTLSLPLYDDKTANPRYLKMNTNTRYSIKIDPAGEELTFTPSVENWLENTVQENE